MINDDEEDEDAELEDEAEDYPTEISVTAPQEKHTIFIDWLGAWKGNSKSHLTLHSNKNRKNSEYSNRVNVITHIINYILQFRFSSSYLSFKHDAPRLKAFHGDRSLPSATYLKVCLSIHPSIHPSRCFLFFSFLFFSFLFFSFLFFSFLFFSFLFFSFLFFSFLFFSFLSSFFLSFFFASLFALLYVPTLS